MKINLFIEAVLIFFLLNLVACGDSDSIADSKKDNEASREKVIWKYLNPEIIYDEITDNRDGQVYKTVTIGNQTWMAENLNYAYTGVKYLSGEFAIHSSDSTSWCYDDNPKNCDRYGRLYTWSAAIDSVALAKDTTNPQICGYGKVCSLPSPFRGICPESWHLPTKAEWEALINSVGGFDLAVSALLSTSSWCGGVNGSNTYGFSVLPSGHYLGNSYGLFELSCYFAEFWTTDEYDGECCNDGFYSYFLRFYPYLNITSLGAGNKDYGYSIRCVKDDGRATD